MVCKIPISWLQCLPAGAVKRDSARMMDATARRCSNEMSLFVGLRETSVISRHASSTCLRFPRPAPNAVGNVRLSGTAWQTVIGPFTEGGRCGRMETLRRSSKLQWMWQGGLLASRQSFHAEATSARDARRLLSNGKAGCWFAFGKTQRSASEHTDCRQDLPA